MSNPTGSDRGAAPQHYGALLTRELQTPVSAILGYLALLEDDGLLDDRETLRQYLAVVRGRAADMARVVSELTFFTDLAGPLGTDTGSSAPTALPVLITQIVGDRPLVLDVSATATYAV